MTNHPNPCVTWNVPRYAHATPEWAFALEVLRLAPKELLGAGLPEFFRVRRLFEASRAGFTAAEYVKNSLKHLRFANCELDPRTAQ